MARKEARMVSQALWLKLTHHLLADDTQRGQNGELGLVVEITTTYILMSNKEARMVSQTLWLK